MAEQAATKISKTDLGKIEKKRRIKDASRALFLSQGFEEATIREIAQMARVAQGTLFLYAASKRDLLFMLYNDMIEEIVDLCQDIEPDQQSLAETLMQFAYIHFRGFTDDLGLARIALVNLNLYDRSAEGARFEALQEQVFDLLTSAFQSEIKRGGLDPDVPISVAVQMIFTIMVEMLKSYIRADIPDIRRLMTLTEGQFRIVLKGLEAKDAALLVETPDIAALIA